MLLSHGVTLSSPLLLLLLLLLHLLLLLPLAALFAVLRP